MSFFFSSKLLLGVGISLAALISPQPTLAHLVESSQATITISEAKAHIVISLPVAAFLNNAGKSNVGINTNELRERQSELESQAMRGIRLSVGGQTSVWISMALALAKSKDDQGESSDQFIAVGVTALDRSQGEITVELDLWRRPTINSAITTNNETKRPAKEMLKVNISIFQNEKILLQKWGFNRPNNLNLFFCSC